MSPRSLFSAEKWRELPRRVRRGLVIAKSDAGNALSWTFGGEKRFREHYAELAGAHCWAFIVGCNNSGTSLLQRILGASAEVSTFEYEGQLYSSLLRVRVRPGSRRLFTEYMDDIVMTPETETGDSARRMVHDLLRNLRSPVAPVVLEKTPANALRMNWLDTVLPDARFIGLYRDGYAVCEGIRRKAGQPLARAARHWNRINEILFENGAKVRRFLPLAYERLAEEPEAAVAEVCAFLNIDSREPLAAASGSFALETVAGSSSKIRNMNRASLARLSEEDRRVIELEAAPMLRRLGYLREGQA